MIPRSVPIAGAAVATAVAMHLGGLSLGTGPEPVEMEGGTVATAALGSAFADLAVGTHTPEEADVQKAVEPEPQPREKPEKMAEKVEPVHPERTQKPEVERTEKVVAQEAEPVEIEETETAEPTRQVATDPVPMAEEPEAEIAMAEGRAEVLEQAPTEKAERPVLALQSAVPAEQPDPVVPVKTAQPVPEAPEAVAPEKVEPVKVEPEVAEAVEPEEVVEPEPEPEPLPENLADVAKVTPPVRPQVPPEPEVVRKEEPKSQPKAAPRGNNQTRTANKGTTQGTRQASAGAGATAQSAANSTGNAAASNYPGKVYRAIARAKRGRVSIRGGARVSFRIATNGALEGISIARSSGSAELDRFAVQQIRRAAPFPVPPAGARRSFTIEIKGQ
ncbi:energy transducer TonB family protein [Chachezhania sediminis]|uniref:energy transducer TonB family protein n=1 Tax=Chachezhania sediminis TaxID=2599291 RepID=UPI00131DB59B|nr:energy transducer TonB [Chachezhania sediminis]